MDKDGPETMREAVARAIFDHMWRNELGAPLPEAALEERWQEEREVWMGRADAAIRTVLERLREPSEAMWTAGRDPILARDGRMPASMLIEQPWYDPERDCAGRKDGYVTKGDCAVWVWRAMLDAAVREVG